MELGRMGIEWAGDNNEEVDNEEEAKEETELDDG